MRDDEISSKGSVSSVGTRSSTAPLVRRGLGRGLRPSVVSTVSDSGVGASASSNEPSVGDSQSISSRVDKGSVSEAFTDADEFSTCPEDDQIDLEHRFSNTNCLFFKELQKNSFQVYKYLATFSRDLSNKDKRLLFLKRVVIEQLGETLLDLPNVIYTLKPIPPDKLSLQSSIHNQEVKLDLVVSDQLQKLEFFQCLLKRMSLYLTSPEAFLALNVMTHQNRFEVYPGDVLDVAERELVVRCSSNFRFNLGTVSDIIEECFIYSAIWRVDENLHREIVERNVHELVVLNETDHKSYVVEKVLWDENENSRRDIYLLRCRRLKSDITVRSKPGVLVVTGSRRTTSRPAERISSGGDKTTSFVGEPATGQQRQLALVRYKEIMDQDMPKSYLHKWGITLIETAVVSNSVVLQTEVLRLQDNTSNLATTQGWTNRLSNLRVLVPVCIKNWYVIYAKGDERLIDDMIDILIGDAPKIGIEMKEPRKRAIAEISAAAYESILSSCLNHYPQTELFMVVVRSNRTDIYNAVKKWSLSQKRPIVTQVLMRDTAKQIRNFIEYSFSVITQINCKLGGALWALDKTVDNTLVIGLSLYTSVQGKDVLGFVSSRNKLFTQWYSYAIMDRDSELKEQLRIAIKKYSLENANALPERIIVLSNQIDDENLPKEIESNVRAVFRGNLTLVHVEDVARYNKMVYQLAVERNISELKAMQKKYLFVPQRAGRELDMICCRLDSNDPGLSPKEIAGVIKQLKHVYYNVAGEVNLPAPVLYAERCAEFVSDVLDGQQNEEIRDKLYYL